MKNTLFVFCCSMVLSAAAMAQKVSPTDPLFKEIWEMDSVLFTAFNNRDLETLRKVFSEDLEFYHDKGGLSNYEQNMVAFKENFAKENWPTRELVKESMEVYPVPGYGAIQTGEHLFCHPENGVMGCWTFKFMSIWRKTDGQWELARVVSYGH